MADGDVIVVRDGHQTLGPPDLQVLQRTLTAAEIHTLNSVPIVLVAGSPNTVVMPTGGYLVYHHVTSGYVFPATLKIGTATLIGTSQEWLDEGIGNVILSQLVSSVSLLFLDDAPIRELTWVEGDDLIIQMDNGDPEPAPDGDGTLTITVFYRVIDVTP